MALFKIVCSLLHLQLLPDALQDFAGVLQKLTHILPHEIFDPPGLYIRTRAPLAALGVVFAMLAATGIVVAFFAAAVSRMAHVVQSTHATADESAKQVISALSAGCGSACSRL